MKQLTIIIISVVLLFNCSKKSANPDESGESEAKISFSPDSLDMVIGEEVELKLNLNLTNLAIFGISMQIEYNPISDRFIRYEDFTVGDYFGQDVISFVQGWYNNSLYITLTLKKGQQKVKGSGELGTFTFSGLHQGINQIKIVPSELYFYDSNGDTLVVSALEINETTINIVSPF